MLSFHKKSLTFVSVGNLLFVIYTLDNAVIICGCIRTESKNTEDDLKRRAYNLSPNVDVISKLLPSVSTWDLFIRYPRIFVTPLPDLKMRLYKLSNLLSHHDKDTLISYGNGNAVDIGSLVMQIPQLLDPAINYEYIEGGSIFAVMKYVSVLD